MQTLEREEREALQMKPSIVLFTHKLAILLQARIEEEIKLILLFIDKHTTNNNKIKFFQTATILLMKSNKFSSILLQAN